MSSNPPAKHHYIPRFQLAQWAVDDGKLWRFLQPYPGKIATKRVAPAEIGHERISTSLPACRLTRRSRLSSSSCRT